MNLFDDSRDIRNPWYFSNTAQHDALFREMKEEFEQLHRETLPKPILRERPAPIIRQPQLRRSGRFSYKVG